MESTEAVTNLSSAQLMNPCIYIYSYTVYVYVSRSADKLGDLRKNWTGFVGHCFVILYILDCQASLQLMKKNQRPRTL